MVEPVSHETCTFSQKSLVVAFLIIGPLLAGTTTAQPRASRAEPDSFINQQRALEESLRRRFDTEVGDSMRALFDWGGWYSLYLFTFDDGVESSRTLRRHDLRLWARLNIDEGAHELYARTRLSLLDFNSGDSYDGNDNDVEGPNLERGFYRFDLARAMRAYADRGIDYNIVIKAGRDLVQFGTGLALAAPLDHVSLRGTYGSFDLTALAGKTVGSSEDFDLSRPPNRTHRDFFGGQLTYRGFERHEPFIYALRQNDRNRETVFPLFQDFNYDSWYIGLGSSGELVEQLRYSTECVYEGGRDFGHQQPIDDKDIEAWSIQAEIEYLFAGEHRARTSIEYLFGSGDPDRPVSPTNTIGSNLDDSQDTAFIGFGYHDTGLSFAPRYGNLHMWRAGASYYPLPDHGRFRNLELGTDWYLYYKHHRSAAVSDPTAIRPASYLGWEMDCYANWRVTSDLAWTARLGAFFPGRAFDDRTTRTFLLVGMTWSF